MNIHTPRLLLTPRQAAAALSISERMLQELRRRAELVPIRLPGRGAARSLRYSVADLEKWIDQQKTAALDATNKPTDER